MKSHIKLTHKIIFVTIIIVIMGNFIFSKPVKANALTDFGGELLEHLTTFGIALGDIVLNALQTNLYIDQKVIIDAHAPGDGQWDWENYGGQVLGVALIVGGLLLSPFTGGATAIGASLILGGSGVAIFASNSAELLNKLVGNFELPMIWYTPYAIFSNSVPIFDINFFSPNEVENKFIKIKTGSSTTFYNVQSESSAKILQETVSGWYYALRNLAIVAMLVILVYIGIRMLIASVSKEKAKYKQMLVDWFVALCLLMIMHYIMIFIVETCEALCDMFSGISVENVIIPLPQGTKYEIDGSGIELEYGKERR